jgi:hypothetical protein
MTEDLQHIMTGREVITDFKLEYLTNPERLTCRHCKKTDIPLLSRTAVHFVARCPHCGGYHQMVKQSIQAQWLLENSRLQMNLAQTRAWANNRGFTVVPMNLKTPLLSWKSPLTGDFPQHNGLAMLLGAAVDINVLDLDGEHGRAFFVKYRHLFNDSAIALSGSGGIHVYFRHVQSGRTVFYQQCRIGEWRSEGQLIVLPGSLHPKGQLYRWVQFGKLQSPEPVLLELLSQPKKPSPALVSEFIYSHSSSSSSAKLLQVAIQNALAWGRNNTGFWLACKLRTNQQDFYSARGIMLQYQQAVGSISTHCYSQTEALSSLKSAYKL